MAALLLLMLPVGFLVAQDDEGRQVDDEIVRGDVTLFNENLSVGEMGQISGNVTLFNGNATVAGTINGDLVVFNGDLTVTETAIIRGECVALNGTVSGPETTNCFEVNELPFASNFMSNGPDVSELMPPSAERNPTDVVLGALFGAFALSVLMGLLAAVVFALAPTATQRVDSAMREQPGASIAVGILSFIAIPFVNFILLLVSSLLIIACVGLLGFPIVLAISLGFVGAGLWSTILWGRRLGNWMTNRLGRPGESIAVVGLGTALLTFAVSFLLFANPFTAILASLLAVVPLAWGMGATGLTRFGTRAFPYRDPVVIPTAEKVASVLKTLDE